MTDICPFCNSSASITDNSINCSNPDCWKALIEVITQNATNEPGDSSDNPIDLICGECGHDMVDANATGFNCEGCRKWTSYQFIPNKWYRSKRRERSQSNLNQHRTHSIIRLVIVQALPPPKYWNMENRIIRDIEE